MDSQVCRACLGTLEMGCDIIIGSHCLVLYWNWGNPGFILFLILDTLQHPVSFLLTTLDCSVSAVLGYWWLCQHSFDWVKHDITFRTPQLEFPPGNAAIPLQLRALHELSAPSSIPAIACTHIASLAPEPSPTTELRGNPHIVRLRVRARLFQTPPALTPSTCSVILHY